MEEGIGQKQVIEKKARPQEQLNCPRCNSSNTKFCYYNNYSLTQPRYFCKTCRRYWTEGGSLRNVPVGGGSRKNKRVSNSSISKVPDLNPPPPKIHGGGHDLNLAFPSMDHQKFQGISPFVEIGDHHNFVVPNNRGLNNLDPNSYLPPPPTNTPSLMSNSSNASTFYSPAFSMQDVKPNNLGFSMDASLPNRSYGVQVQDNGGASGRLLFPFGEMKHLSSSVEVEHNKDQANSSGYWSGMIGEGSSW